jgi:peptidoglycan-associated lipoprotein
MQLNKVLKGLLIALPVLAVTACSSSDEAANASDSAQTTNQSTETTATTSTEATDTTVVSPMVDEPQLSEQELKEQALRESQTIYFAFDNSTIETSYEEMLSAHASYLSANTNLKVVIEGHADERGTPEYNIALGERRAMAVSKYLQASGVDADQISIVSFGEEKPLLLGQSEAVYAKNRRAVLVY